MVGYSREARAQLDAARETAAAREVDLARVQSRLESSTQQLQAARRQRDGAKKRRPASAGAPASRL